MTENANWPDFGDTDPTLGNPGKRRAPETEMDRIATTTGLDMDGFFEQLRVAGSQLLEKRKELSLLRAQRVRLEARYGSHGQSLSHWDHQRKTLLAEISEQRREDLRRSNEALLAQDPKAKPEKVTVGEIDDYAHAHPRYRQFLEESYAERMEYVGYKAQLDQLYGEIEHLQGVREYLIQRLRLNEEAVRHARTMANLGA